MTDLTGTTAVVTGASRGFGRAIATALIGAGAHVVGVSRTVGAPLDSLESVTADATDPSLALDEDDLTEPEDQKHLLDSYAEAFERADLDALAELVRDDVILEMPPRPDWYLGRADVLAFLRANVLQQPGRWRMVPTRANDQPAALSYEGEGDEEHGLHVLDIRDGRIVFFRR